MSHPLRLQVYQFSKYFFKILKSEANYHSGHEDYVHSLHFSQHLSTPSKFPLSTSPSSSICFNIPPLSSDDKSSSSKSTSTSSSGDGVSSNSNKVTVSNTTKEEYYVINIRNILSQPRIIINNTNKNSPVPDSSRDEDETNTTNSSTNTTINTLEMNEKSENQEITEDDLVPPTNCCMSGCPTCVWIEYVEKLSKFYSNSNLSREKIHSDVNSIPDTNIRAVLIMELKFRGLW